MYNRSVQTLLGLQFCNNHILFLLFWNKPFTFISKILCLWWIDLVICNFFEKSVLVNTVTFLQSLKSANCNVKVRQFWHCISSLCEHCEIKTHDSFSSAPLLLLPAHMSLFDLSSELFQATLPTSKVVLCLGSSLWPCYQQTNTGGICQEGGAGLAI